MWVCLMKGDPGQEAYVVRCHELTVRKSDNDISMQVTVANPLEGRGKGVR